MSERIPIGDFLKEIDTLKGSDSTAFRVVGKIVAKYGPAETVSTETADKARDMVRGNGLTKKGIARLHQTLSAGLGHNDRLSTLSPKTHLVDHPPKSGGIKQTRRKNLPQSLKHHLILKKSK